MEESFLNQAHFENRKAERLSRQGKLDEAIESHEKASNLLNNALTLTDLSTVQQSLLCQKDYHIRQIWLLQSKITSLSKYLSNKKMNTGNEEETKDGDSSSLLNSQQETQHKMRITQMEIMRTLSEADAALHLHADSCTSMDPNLNQVIDCLQKMRHQLEDLFQFSRESNTATDFNNQGAIQPVDDDADSMPKSLSPDDETDQRSRALESELPVLPPLQVPRFDFNNFD